MKPLEDENEQKEVDEEALYSAVMGILINLIIIKKLEITRIIKIKSTKSIKIKRKVKRDNHLRNKIQKKIKVFDKIRITNFFKES